MRRGRACEIAAAFPHETSLHPIHTGWGAAAFIPFIPPVHHRSLVGGAQDSFYSNALSQLTISKFLVGKGIRLDKTLMTILAVGFLSILCDFIIRKRIFIRSVNCSTVE